ncbi:MAG: hypothetical protein Q4F34_05100 [Prevotellaceae bacterium]|nr:hypothetical protein [Prevotellaceae bacterium]
MKAEETKKPRTRKTKVEEVIKEVAPVVEEIAPVKQETIVPDKKNEKLSFKNMTRGQLWEYQENDIFTMLKKAEREADFFETYSHYISMIKGAFMVENYNLDSKPEKMSLEKQGFKIGSVKVDDVVKGIALKKKAIKRVTDFTYENIRHISAAKMLEVISNNFGGGWDSISQSIRDIIESGFDVSTTTLPTDRLHKEGGLYEKKIADGCDVLEIEKGTWTEAIFAKVRPIVEIPKMTFGSTNNEDGDDEDLEDERDDYNNDLDMDDEDEEMNEDNYSTRFDIPEEDVDGDMSLDSIEDDDE